MSLETGQPASLFLSSKKLQQKNRFAACGSKVEPNLCWPSFRRLSRERSEPLHFRYNLLSCFRKSKSPTWGRGAVMKDEGAVRAREVLERKRNEHKPSPLGLVTEVG